MTRPLGVRFAFTVCLLLTVMAGPAAAADWVLWHVRESYGKDAFPFGSPRDTMQRILESGLDRQACELVRGNHIRASQQPTSIARTSATANGAVMYLSASTTENSYLCVRAGERPRPAFPISPPTIPAPSSSTTIYAPAPAPAAPAGPPRSATPITPEEAAAMNKRTQEQSGSRRCETKVYGGGAAVTVCD